VPRSDVCFSHLRRAAKHGLVLTVLTTDPEVLGAIPGATRFSESRGSITGSTQLRGEN
jgi:hypothetical protein